MSIGVFIRIKDAEVWHRFKLFVLQKYRKLHGALGLEVTKALDFYLKSQNENITRTHINDLKVSKANSRTLRNLGVIVSQILSETQKEIPQTHVERIIALNVGAEKRTIQRYLSHLVYDYKVLKPVRAIAFSPARRGSREVKYIYEVNLGEAKKLIGLHTQ